ncbi:acyl-CoA thioesterase [Stratiformator vulcanicus]|uniref:Acyl-CoA thioester hydrolase YbgC n=1 Tax=Stratiformator vulcanicus TaxID=2527980 RepID=A0A517R0G0_9PLAN|nr:thioesterase family protein [Stratiformator vulcanicus]QDT37314.1 Acyl-CoA thioester hydrolase YbgC [Stratiformator vulcanicus]
MLHEHTIEIRVRYAETDAMGFVHQSHYLTYFEQGRTEMLRASGGTYRAIEESGLLLVLVKAEINYKKPAHYDDLLTLTTRIADVSPAKLIHSYEIKRGDQLLNAAKTTLACIDRNGKVHQMSRLFPHLFEGS